MKIEWRSIRNQLEKEYGDKEFECIYDDKYKPCCICISGVAMNYVANEIKIMKGCAGEEEIKWNNSLNRYLCQGTSEQIIPNLQMEKESKPTIIPMESLCNPEKSEYTYIKIRKSEEIKKESNDKDIECYINSLEDSNHFKWYSAYAKEFRMSYEMPEYIDKLFRLFFFFNPFKGYRIIKRELKKYGEDKDFLDYNYKLLKDYLEMAKAFGRKDASDNIIRMISDFVGSDLIVLHIYFEDTKDFGDIRGINDLLLDCANSAKKYVGKEKESKMQLLKKEIKKKRNVLALAPSG